MNIFGFNEKGKTIQGLTRTSVREAGDQMGTLKVQADLYIYSVTWRVLAILYYSRFYF